VLEGDSPVSSTVLGEESEAAHAPLHALIRQPPCTVAPHVPLLAAVRQMAQERASAAVVVDTEQRPVGVFTNDDLQRRVVAPQVDIQTPIESVMSCPPITMSGHATLADALLEMATRRVHHIVLVDSTGALAGLVSERDCFALLRVGVAHLRRAIERAENLDALRCSLSDVRRNALHMLAQGAGAEKITQFISAANDSVVRRIIELRLREHDLDGLDWAWLAFGSEGREEQTLATDQDNGIVFICPDLVEREPLQLRFLDFALAVNHDLDACGFPLCKGNVMASNPQWCLTLDEWKEKFSMWVQSPQPDALLNATIFFDLRAIFGPINLAAQMYQHLFMESRASPIFQRILAQQALAVSPPLGLIRDFTTESDPGGSAFIDLKKYGARLFIDAARVLAMRHGLYEASTISRLRQASSCSGRSEDVEALIDAFQFIQLLRLRHQYDQSERGQPCDNRVEPEKLNQLDRRILVEAFKQAKRLQQSLKLAYQL
jgi:CBS domain-containing protein